jgi:hypothetical protein
LKIIIQNHVRFHEELMSGNKQNSMKRLESKGIHLLDGFISNQHLVEAFHDKYYVDNVPRIVLCGINPGRNGAGKTGVPFLDFHSLSHLLPCIDNHDRELSAEFIYDIILRFGAEKFFKHVYLTNVSWFGFANLKGNVNYYELDTDLQDIFTNGFVEEMTAIRPITIIPLSKRVEATLQSMKMRNLLPYPISKPLGHPYYYSNFKSRRLTGLELYISTIKEHMA